MAKQSTFIKLDSIKKKTSIGGNSSMIKTSSMNKSKRNSYKQYRGQGRG
tara:strand:- start:90 stop:236 length:147 start_codon:yes stop_codon:yes gene_type:complete